MNSTRAALKRQTRPSLLILWLVLAGLGLCTDFVGTAPTNINEDILK